jgi:lysozyme
MKWKALSAVGLIAIALHEGYSDKPYLDVAGIWTNGFGNTHNAQQKTNVPQALDQLGRNVKAAEDAVNRCVTSYMGQQTFDSFVSFTYNVGGGAFCNSTMVKKFNAGDKHAACDELPKWSCVTVGEGKGDKSGICASKKDNKRLVNGLYSRRMDERQMCLEGLQ